MNSKRRFPPPWSVEEQDAYYVVRDRGGQALSCVYFEEEPDQRSAAKLLTKDEARRIAANKGRDLFFHCGVYLRKRRKTR